MGVRITNGDREVALYDSVSGHAFGMIFDSYFLADEFVNYAAENGVYDLRKISDEEFNTLYEKWLTNRKED